MIFLASLFLPGFFSHCAFGDAGGVTNNQTKLQILQGYLNSSGSMRALVNYTDDQSDGDISTFNVVSAGTTFSITITYSRLDIDKIQLNLRPSLVWNRPSSWKAAFLKNLIVSELAAHPNDPVTPTSGSNVYFFAQGAQLNSIHTANASNLTGSIFQSQPFLLTGTSPGSVQTVALHATSFVIGGTMTNGTGRAFEIRLPAFDVVLAAKCAVRVQSGSTSDFGFLIKLPSLLADTGASGDAQIVNSLWGKPVSFASVVLNPGIIAEIQKNTGAASASQNNCFVP